MSRTFLTCAAAAVLLIACTAQTPDDVRTADSAADLNDDSDDYSAWFEGMSESDIEDFEAQFDADQLLYPTEIAEPEHEPAPSSVRMARAGGSARATPTRAFNTIEVGSGSDAGVGTDASPAPDSGTAVVDAGVDADAGTDAGTDAGVDANTTCGPFQFAASLMLDAQFGVSVAPQYVGTFGPVRRHDIYVSGSASGTANLTLAGSITASADSWTATISVTGMAQATAAIQAFQAIGPRNRWFSVGEATLSGNVGFSDSVTFTQTCNPPGVVATTPGTPAITANLTIDDATFHGYFFPRLQGPIVTRLRGAIAQFARNFANRRLAELIQPQVFGANQAYAKKKQELLDKLVNALPKTCGCAPAN